MFGVPVDAWYVWLGLSLASIALIGVGAALPTAPPPSAATAAETVDRTAVTAHTAAAELPLSAREIRLTPAAIGLRNDAGTTHATFAFGPVTPVVGTAALLAVLHGATPGSRFDSGATLCDAAASARERTPRWRRADDPLVVRHLVWEGCDVTLVG
ncbi:DUF7283 family protein [Haloplanus halobius]|uniref:DUF7283 family protein n=1 Tax=Haloplanus halobius TaxID=2934938 RepID=UPI00200C73E3|nr:hypothetical protein [Haloplanus sp. XH21]